MSLNLRWIGASETERLAMTRLRCYGAAMNELPKFQAGVTDDARATFGDFLVADRDGEAVGTTTSLSLNMWVRGARLPCQGVAWVGTIRTARRESDGKSAGVATALMNETVRKGREREQVVSALMPFRASFYEHFGYGIVERRNQWFVPLSILPSGSSHGIRYFDSENDLAAMKSCRQRQVESGQCDIETSDRSWPNYLRDSGIGFSFIDRPNGATSARGWLMMSEEKVDSHRCLRISEQAYDSTESFIRQLHFLAGLKDQFHGITMILPTDLPLHHFLREPQVPHRPVEHVASRMSMHTRMQVRILDHVKFFESQTFPATVSGEAVIAVRESEGGVSKFRLRIDGGRATAKSDDASADFECTDARWASIACGELRASIAVQANVATSSGEGVTKFLDAISAANPAPFCREYF